MCDCIWRKTHVQLQIRILELEKQLAEAYRDARVALSKTATGQAVEKAMGV